MMSKNEQLNYDILSAARRIHPVEESERLDRMLSRWATKKIDLKIVGGERERV